MKTSHRIAAGMVLLVCAALLATALGTRGWATASGGRDSKYLGDTVKLGLFSFEACNDGHCRVRPWSDMGEDMRVPSAVRITEGLAIAAAMLGIALLAIGGLFALGGVFLPRSLMVRGLATAFWLQFAFAASLTTWDSFSPSFSAVLGLLGAGGGSLLARFAFPRRVVAMTRPALPLPLPPPPPPPPLPMQWPPPPPCAWCSASTQWSGHDRRWWCRRCAQLS